MRPLVLPTAFGAGLLLLWQALVVIFGYPKVILPAPSDIYLALTANFGTIWQQTVPTVRDTLAGFALAAIFGVGLASLLSFSRLLRNAIYPLVVVIQLVPKIAWTPLFIVWVGIGWPSRLTIAAFIGFFPIFIAMMAGLESTDRSLVRLCRGLMATPWRTFWLVRLPASTPYLFAGLKIAITLAVIGVIVAEFISSSEGFGLPDPAERRPAAHRYHPCRHHRPLPRGPCLLRRGSCGRSGRAQMARRMTDIGLPFARPVRRDFGGLGRDAARLIAPPVVTALLLLGGWEALSRMAR